MIVVRMVRNCFFHCLDKVILIRLLHGFVEVHAVGICYGSGVGQWIKNVKCGVVKHTCDQEAEVHDCKFGTVFWVD